MSIVASHCEAICYHEGGTEAGVDRERQSSETNLDTFSKLGQAIAHGCLDGRNETDEHDAKGETQRKRSPPPRLRRRHDARIGHARGFEVRLDLRLVLEVLHLGVLPAGDGLDAGEGAGWAGGQ